MNLRVVTPPESEPVSVETMKEHLRVDTTSEDALILAYLRSARELGEGLARRAFITQTLELVLDAWPADGILKLPRPPLQSVVSVKYLDKDGMESTWTDYRVNSRSEPGQIYFNSVPSVSLDPSGGAIAVRFTAGYVVSTVPNVFAQGILLTVAHWYENREAVNVGNIVNEIPLGYKPLFLSDRGGWF